MMRPEAVQAYEGIKASKLKLDVSVQSKKNVQTLKSELEKKPSISKNVIQDFCRKVKELQFVLVHRSTNWLAIKDKHKGAGSFANSIKRKDDAKLMSLFDLAKMKAKCPQKYVGDETEEQARTESLWELASKSLYIFMREGEKKAFSGDTDLDWQKTTENDVQFTFTKIAGVSIDNLKICDIKDFRCIYAMLHFPEHMRTMEKDFTQWGNSDFCFFRWRVAGSAVDEGPQKKRDIELYGEAAKYFTDSRLHTEGFISFNDWDDYLHEDDHYELPVTFDEKWKPLSNKQLTIIIPADQESTYIKRYEFENRKLKVELKDEVFFGEEIHDGLALSLLRLLLFLDPSLAVIEELNKSKEFDVLVGRLIANIWPSMEAKLPGSMLYYDFKVPKAWARQNLYEGGYEVGGASGDSEGEQASGTEAGVS